MQHQDVVPDTGVPDNMKLRDITNPWDSCVRSFADIYSLVQATLKYVQLCHTREARYQISFRM